MEAKLTALNNLWKTNLLTHKQQKQVVETTDFVSHINDDVNKCNLNVDYNGIWSFTLHMHSAILTCKFMIMQTQAAAS